jgi:hypothetical protein
MSFIYHPLRRIESSAATKLEYVQGGGFKLPIIMGVPITAIGLFCVVLALGNAFGAFPRQRMSTYEAVLSVLIPLAVGLLFSSAGSWFIFGRTTVILDKEAATVTMRSSFFSLGRTAVSSLAGFTHVEVMRKFDEAVAIYSVSLIGPASTRRLVSCADRATAELAGGEISEFLGLPTQTRDGR